MQRGLRFGWTVCVTMSVAGLVLSHPTFAAPAGMAPSTQTGTGVRAVLAAQADGRFRLFLLTMDPGAEIYSSWGHTALRLDDTLSGQQIVFDYGLFRFDSAFLFRFLKGDPIYMLGVSTWRTTLERYRRSGRGIRAQRLLLPAQEAEAFARVLARNAMPENRNYVYNHYTNNCTTVYRDHLDRLLAGEFRRAFGELPTGRTLRDFTVAPLQGKPFVRLGVHLILNADTDRPANAWQEMFVPEALLLYLEAHRTSKATTAGILGPVEVMLEGQRPQAWLRPLVGTLLSGVLAASLLLGAFGRGIWQKRARILALWLWSICLGLVGVALFSLNFFSAFEVFHRNLNLFAFHPLLLALPFLDAVCARMGKRATQWLYAVFVSWPAVGLFLALTNISAQYSEPFLVTALLAHSALFVARLRGV